MTSQTWRHALRWRATTDAARRFQDGTACTQHAYTTAKGVQCHGVKIDSAGSLIVPMRDMAGKLHSLQTITPEVTSAFTLAGA